MKRLFLLCLSFGFSSFAFAGGDWAEAKITSFGFNDRAQVVFEFEWVNSNGFLSQSDYKKLVFEFHNWPSSSNRWLHQALPWTPNDDRTYPLADVAACKNFLLNAFANKSVIKLGQMGTVPFQPSILTENAGVVPYAKVKQQANQDVCMLYAAPI